MRNGHTLCELLAVLGILSALTAVAAPPAVRSRNRATVRAAATAVRATLSAARDHALSHATAALVVINPALATITVVANHDTVLRHSLAADARVTLSATRDSIRFGPTGRAFGASNTTVVIRSGTVAETVTVSRLGRVR